MFILQLSHVNTCHHSLFLILGFFCGFNILNVVNVLKMGLQSRRQPLFSNRFYNSINLIVRQYGSDLRADVLNVPARSRYILRHLRFSSAHSISGFAILPKRNGRHSPPPTHPQRFHATPTDGGPILVYHPSPSL